MSTTPVRIGTAERKILIVFVYNLITGFWAVVNFMLLTRDAPQFAEELGNYFHCEAMPFPGQPCTRGYRQYSHPVVTSIALVLLGLLSVVNLIFVIDTKWAKNLLQLLKRVFIKDRQPSSGATGTSSKAT